MTPPVRQRGVALLVLLAVLVMGAAWWLVSAMATRANRVALERSQNAPVLRLAKQAVIGYAAQQAGTNDLNPGSLPCPEAAANIGTVNEGIAAGNCTLPAVGRLPWRTLGIDKLHDAAGEPLWYIVSPGWAKPNNATPTLGINANSAGNLTVDGQANAAAAMIVAPGPQISLAPNPNQVAAGCVARTQVRTPAAPNPLDYVECQNLAAGILRTSVVDNSTNPVFNDQMVAISAAEVLAAVDPVVAARIQRDVVPQLQSIYADPTWGPGISAANPLFPFAVQYGDPVGDPVTSSFKGTAGKTEGLLPVTSSVCNPMTNGPCDGSFVQWDTASISVTKRSGTANITGSNCAASTGNQVSCTISYEGFCGGGLGCLLGCTCSVTLDASVLASARNVGLSMRRFTAAPITGFGSLISTDTPLAANGAANVDIRGNFPSNTCNALLILGLVIPCLANGTATVTIPIGVFPDHPFLNAQGPTPLSLGTPPDAWFWFLANKWHHVTYYAVAPLHAPGAAGNCAGANCLSVTVQAGTNLSDRRAILLLGGNSLNGTIGSNRTLADFLDTAENRNLDLRFEQNKPNRFFNDRVVGLSP
jgi:hypothetical protein